jgi:hypothetical protein
VRENPNHDFMEERIFTTPGYYYMEITTANWGGTGFYKLALKAPLALSPSNLNPTWQVDKITIEQTSLLPEVLSVEVDAGALASISRSSFTLYYLVLEYGMYVRK